MHFHLGRLSLPKPIIKTPMLGASVRDPSCTKSWRRHSPDVPYCVSTQSFATPELLVQACVVGLFVEILATDRFKLTDMNSKVINIINNDRAQ